MFPSGGPVLPGGFCFVTVQALIEKHYLIKIGFLNETTPKK